MVKSAVMVVLLAGLVGLLVFVNRGSAVSRDPSKYACLSSMKHTVTGMLMYADDNDSHVPPAGWMEPLFHYVKDERMFRCPNVAEGGFGYAINRFLAGKKLVTSKEAELMPLLHETKDLGRNVCEYFPQTPIPGRHSGSNNVVFADGHCEAIPITTSALQNVYVSLK